MASPKYSKERGMHPQVKDRYTWEGGVFEILEILEVRPSTLEVIIRCEGGRRATTQTCLHSSFQDYYKGVGQVLDGCWELIESCEDRKVREAQERKERRCNRCNRRNKLAGDYLCGKCRLGI